VLTTVLEHEVVRKGDGFIVMNRDGKRGYIELADIVWVSVDGSFINLHLCNNKVEEYLLKDYPFGKMEEILGISFIRIYRSIIVNKQYFEEADYSKKTIKLKGVDQTFPIGITYSSSVKKCFGDTTYKRG